VPWILNHYRYGGDELVSSSSSSSSAAAAAAAAASVAAASVAATERGEKRGEEPSMEPPPAVMRDAIRGHQSPSEAALPASAATRAMMRVIVPAVRPFVPQSPEGGLGGGPTRAHVSAAQADMLSLCARHGTYRSPSQLVDEAVPLNAPGRTKPGPLHADCLPHCRLIASLIACQGGPSQVHCMMIASLIACQGGPSQVHCMLIASLIAC
jgi:hypothetical protein